MKLSKLASVIALTAAIGLGGCATIAGDQNQTIPILSSPSDAKISIVDERGIEVFRGQTPTYANLPKSDGTYFGGKNFTVTISKDGFKTQYVRIKSSANGYYVLGNFVFGGIIGWLIVDPMSGKMYTLSVDYGEKLNAKKYISHEPSRPDQYQEKQKATDSIEIMLLQDVPEELKDNLVPIH